MVKRVTKFGLGAAVVRLFKGKKPELPTEDASVRTLRERQVRELAELDEEENRRLKAAFRTGRGIRAFRRSGGGINSSSGGGINSSSGQTGQRAFTIRGGVAP